MTTQSNSEYERDLRTAYKAIDAIQLLQDRGRGSGNTERAMQAIREVINDIEALPRRSR